MASIVRMSTALLMALIGMSQAGGCPRGMFTLSGSNECFKLITDYLPWSSGKERCVREGLVLARPSDDIALKLRNYLQDTYGDGFTWVGARGTGRRMAWLVDGLQVRRDMIWLNYDVLVNPTHCLGLAATEGYVKDHPTIPYGPTDCPDGFRVLCQDFCSVAGGTRVGVQCLFFEDDSKIWTDSVKACEAKGQQLAISLDPGALKAYHTKNFGYWEAFWLGGSDRAIEGRWVWIDGKSFDRFPWEFQQPDNDLNYSVPGSQGQNCLAVGWRHTFDDKACTEVNRYICELKG